MVSQLSASFLSLFFTVFSFLGSSSSLGLLAPMAQPYLLHARSARRKRQLGDRRSEGRWSRCRPRSPSTPDRGAPASRRRLRGFEAHVDTLSMARARVSMTDQNHRRAQAADAGREDSGTAESSLALDR